MNLNFKLTKVCHCAFDLLSSFHSDTDTDIFSVDSNKENASSMDIENSPSNIIKKGLTKPVKLNNDVTILPSSKVCIFFV